LKLTDLFTDELPANMH